MPLKAEVLSAFLLPEMAKKFRNHDPFASYNMCLSN